MSKTSDRQEKLVKDKTVSEIPEKSKLVPPKDPTQRRIYWLNRLKVTREDGSQEELRPTPEVVAVAIAKCSRMDTPFDQNVDDVPLKKAAEFHEKWVVGYGHSSVAEHATSSVAIENISQVVTKIIEDSRLASYTEKSSRYQVFTRDRAVTPLAIKNSTVAEDYTRAMDGLYSLYEELRGPIAELMRERFPKAEGLSDKGYEAQIKARTFDVVRSLLPAASMTSFGMTGNARVWEHVISKLLSHPLEEAQAVGLELRNALKGEADLDPDVALAERPHPILLKYAAPKPYLNETPEALSRLAKETFAKISEAPSSLSVATPERPVVMLYDDAEAEARVAAALLVRVTDRPYTEVFQRVKNDPALIEQVLTTALEPRGPHDQPLRELEHATFSHEIVMDYGAWRDIQRHRMCTQTNQALGLTLGYDVPEEIQAVGYTEHFHHMMQEITRVHAALLAAGLRHEAEYIVPMAYRRRLLVTWNLRELFHFIELRSGIKGHPSYRRIAQEIWRTLEQTHPFIAKFIRVDLRGDEASVSTVGAKPKGI